MFIRKESFFEMIVNKKIMKKKLIRQFAAMFILVAFTAISVFAQDSAYPDSAKAQSAKLFANKKNVRTFSVGVNAGVLTPVAAIGGSNDFTKWQPTFGYGGYIKNQFTHNIAVQADFLRGTLKANNNKELGNGTALQSPYSSYKTELHWAGSLSGVVTFGNVNWFNERNAVIPYVSVGGGIASYNPVLMQSDKASIDYKPGESIKEFYVPVGAGIKLNVATGINIDLGYRMNFVDGDNLDGYRAGTQKDKFSYGFAGLEFAVGNSTTPQLMMVNPAAELRRDLQDENNALSASLTESEQRTEQKLALIGNLQNELAQLKKDSDSDGVSDYFDKCAGTAANEKVDGSGCALPKPEVVKEEPKVMITEEDRRIVNEAFHDLEFDFGKTTIRAKSYSTLDKVATLLVNKNFSLKLAGHTDNVGSESANMKLSKDRAEALKAYLVSKGANPSRIEATGYGETQPITSNKTAAGRQKNRRVEFTLY
jgi:OOP family OmpA-OmpF porin